MVDASQKCYRSLLHDVGYDSFLAGLLLTGETPTGVSLPYQSITFQSPTSIADANNGPFSLELRPGQLLLTNQRLLLLSCIRSSSNELQAFGDPKKLPGGYSVSSVISDTRFFWPLPISSLLTLRMDVDVGINSQINIMGKKNTDCCSCITQLCCLKRWIPQPLQQIARNNRRIEMCLNIPPWNQKSIMIIHVDPLVDFEYIKTFVVGVQKSITDAIAGRIANESNVIVVAPQQQQQNLFGNL